VSAFHATLEEALRADVLVIVNDGASPDMLRQHDTVEQVLAELGATSQPRVEVINKCDLLEGAHPYPGAVEVSALTGENLDGLKKAIRKALGQTQVTVAFSVPYSAYHMMAPIRAAGRILEETHTDTGTCLKISMTPQDRDRLISQIGTQYIARQDG
ncbi:MAG: hypothetical protein II141_01990, partial [Clostridia bacterium]|nr:hypothetical protein [Clostridia bacterium]